MSLINAVVFDMYDTLASNPQESWIALFEEICQAQGFQIEPLVLYQEWKALEIQFRRTRLNLADLGNSPPFKSYEEAWQGCFQRVFSHLKLDGHPAEAAKAAIRSMRFRDLYEEVPQALSIIQSRWKTALLSNADDDYLLPLLDRLGLMFQEVLTSERVRAYKPHPLPFLQILERLKVQPQEAVYVGDSPLDDILGANSVGMRTVWVNRTGGAFDDGLPAPDYQVRSLVELPEILERWDQWS